MGSNGKNDNGIMIWATASNRFYYSWAQRRDNPQYRLFQARRYVKALEEEGLYKYTIIPVDEYHRYQVRLGYHGLRYKSFPTSTGAMVVISDMGFEILDDTYQCGYLPIEIEKVANLIADWIGDIPKGKRVSGTRGLGGSFAGKRRSRNKPGEYIPVLGTKENVLDSFDDLPKGILKELSPFECELLYASLRLAQHNDDITLMGITKDQIGRVLVYNGLVNENYIPN